VRRAAVLLLAVAACEEVPPPPAHSSFEGLPVTGSLADARAAGFTNCMNDGSGMRCRREGVFVRGWGPFSAAVDLLGSDGRGGFRQLTLWHDRDQDAPYEVTETLQREGWRACLTEADGRGDQQVLTRAGVPVRFSADISYWGRRRLRILPGWSGERGC
jgi:hypothetical protein